MNGLQIETSRYITITGIFKNNLGSIGVFFVIMIFMCR